jgi:lactate dehydrogenase-like 2-hydroxyacid dehydrogenase
MPDTLPALLVTRRLTPAIEARAQARFRAHLTRADQPIPPAVLIGLADGHDALLVAPGDRLDAAVINALPASIRIIATFSVGHDHIDLPAARARGLIVTNTPDVLTDATADIALLLLLGAARRAAEGDALIRAGGWTGWAPTQMLGLHVGGKTLAILGMGRIGRAVARRARGFGMIIHYANRSRLPPDLEQDAVFHPDPETMLPIAQFLSLHCPAGPDTHHWLDGRRLARLPAGAVVVNTARGSIVDDTALINALKSGHVAAAGLDVFENEPHLNPDYRTLANTFLLPHLGSATIETRDAMGARALDNLDAFFAGKPPPDRVA